MTELRKCPNPWCVGEQGVEASRNIHTDKWHICCDDCMIEGPWADTEAEAIEAWNTRTAPEGLAAELAKLLELQRLHCDWTHDKAVSSFMETNGQAILTALSNHNDVVEECARIAESHGSFDDNLHRSIGMSSTGERIAQAIRSKKS